MIRKDRVETRYLSEMPLMTSIGVIRAMVVFPQSHHYPPQRGGTLVTAGRRPADIQSSTINHQPSIINHQSSTPSLSLIRLLKGSSMSPHRSSSRRLMKSHLNHTSKGTVLCGTYAIVVLNCVKVKKTYTSYRLQTTGFCP